MPLCCLCHLLCSLWRRWGRGSGTAPHTQVGQWQVMQVASFSSNVGTFWISNFLQGTISSPARELWSHVRSCITSLSLLACVWLWNIVCGPDRVVCDYLLMWSHAVSELLSPIIVQYEHSRHTDVFSQQCKCKRDSVKWRTLMVSVTCYIAKEIIICGQAQIWPHLWAWPNTK